MRVGPKKAQVNFQGAKDFIFTSSRGKFAVLYLDGIVIFPKSPIVHIGKVRSVLQLRYKSGSSLRWTTAKISFDTIDYLGHTTWHSHLEPSEHMTEEVIKLESFPTRTEYHFFLGLCNIFRRFVPSLARDTALLDRKLKKKKSRRIGFWDEWVSSAVFSFKWCAYKSTSSAATKNQGPVYTPRCSLRQGKCVYTHTREGRWT